MSDNSNDKITADTPAEIDQKQPEIPAKKSKKNEGRESNPVRRLTKIVLYVCLFLFIWYLFGDRITPYTDQARVGGFIVPIAPKVSGTLVGVDVKNNQIVSSGDVLAQIDPRDYEIAVQSAKASVDSTGQTLGVETAAIKSAAAKVADEVAQLERAQQDFERVQRIAKLDPGAVSKSELDRVQIRLGTLYLALGLGQDGLTDRGDVSIDVRAVNDRHLLGDIGRELVPELPLVAGGDDADVALVDAGPRTAEPQSEGGDQEGFGKSRIRESHGSLHELTARKTMYFGEEPSREGYPP